MGFPKFLCSRSGAHGMKMSGRISYPQCRRCGCTITGFDQPGSGCSMPDGIPTPSTCLPRQTVASLSWGALPVVSSYVLSYPDIILSRAQWFSELLHD
jgi:hypothetical protein